MADRREKPREKAWSIPLYTSRQVAAIQALNTGTADADQQKRALEWILRQACEYGAGYEPYRSDADGGERETSFALGRQFVARQILRLATMPPDMIHALRTTEDRDEHRRSRSDNRDPDKRRAGGAGRVSDGISGADPGDDAGA